MHIIAYRLCLGQLFKAWQSLARVVVVSMTHMDACSVNAWYRYRLSC